MYFGILSERVKAVNGNMPETVRVYWDRGGVSVPRRRAETHKGDYGKLLIVGGSVGYTGAPNLCARSAVRSGAGLVYLGVPEAIYPIAAGACASSSVRRFRKAHRGRALSAAGVL